MDAAVAARRRSTPARRQEALLRLADLVVERTDRLPDVRRPGTGGALAAHPDVDMVALTGSTRAGGRGDGGCVPYGQDLHLEPGGKAPAVAFVDVDPVRALADAPLFNAGQDCTVLTRVLAQRGVHDALLSALA